MSILSQIFEIRALRYLLTLCFVAGSSGCIPLPGSSAYFEHDLAVSVGARHYDFKRFYACQESLELSEGDGKFHPRWRKSGWEAATTQLADGRVLIFRTAPGDCQKSYQDIANSKDELSQLIFSNVVRLLDNAENPQRLYVVTDTASGFPIRVEHDFVKRIDRHAGDIGPTKVDLELKEQIRKRQHGFQRVTVDIFPYEEWATTLAARDYFSQFQTVTVAKDNNTPALNQPVRFPFYQDRIQMHVDRSPDGVNRLGTIYDGAAFRIQGNEVAQVWYATNSTAATRNLSVTPPAIVNYKGTVFKVWSSREVYDPETRSILSFTNWHTPYPWGAPEPADLERKH